MTAVVGHVSVSTFYSRRAKAACGACVVKSSETDTEGGAERRRYLARTELFVLLPL